MSYGTTTSTIELVNLVFDHTPDILHFLDLCRVFFHESEHAVQYYAVVSKPVDEPLFSLIYLLAISPWLDFTLSE